MYCDKVDIEEISFKKQRIKTTIEQVTRYIPIQFGSYVENYSDINQKPDKFEAIVVGPDVNTLVAIIYLKSQSQTLNEYNKPGR